MRTAVERRSRGGKDGAAEVRAVERVEVRAVLMVAVRAAVERGRR